MITIFLLTLSTFATIALAARTFFALRRYTYPGSAKIDVNSDLPTVSVCIAARNETHALAQCLERVLSSDYPKLEILVLDDSSSDDTSFIIKSFANAGVRFIPGKPLAEGWLGKNHAYQTLVDEASGDLLLFIDVDTCIRPSSISSLVATLHQCQASMISVLPRRDDSYRASAVFGTMRYYWELLLGTATSPPAASALWMVKADALHDDGIALTNYGLSVRPERHMARQLHRQKKYRYFIGSPELGVSYEKHLHSQHETALRLYYPMTGRSIINWLLCSIFLSLLLVPMFVIAWWQWTQVELFWSMALIGLVAGVFGLFVKRTYSSLAWQLRIAIGPLLIIQELLLLLVSYFKYRHGAITWKGRQIHAQPSRHDALRLNE
ncbi:MAG: glycosyltransferase family 2 protein [Candidatus Saccharimonadales bacterium]